MALLNAESSLAFLLNQRELHWSVLLVLLIPIASETRALSWDLFLLATLLCNFKHYHEPACLYWAQG